MPKISLVQNNFTAGEITPYLHGRPDFPLYANGVEYLNNFIVVPHGGVMRRPGFKSIAPVKWFANKSDREYRLVPFVYSETESFVLEFGKQYIRFFKNDETQIESTPGTPYELATPYLPADIPYLSYTQSANVLYIFHENYQPRRLIRVSDTNWQLTTVEFYDGPYHNNNVLDIPGDTNDWSFTPSAIGAVGDTITIEIKDSGGTPILPFSSTDIGRYIRIQHVTGTTTLDVTWGVAKITSLNGASPQLNVEVVVPFGAATESKDWRTSIFKGPDRWPKFGTMHEGRLVVAASNDYPNSFWGSVIDDLTNFSPSGPDGQVIDSNGFNYTLGSNTIDTITWLSSGKALLMGTLAGPYSITGGDIRIPVGPLAVKATKENSFGSARIPAVFIERSHIYFSQTKRDLREMFYSYEEDAFLSPSLTLRAEHLFRDWESLGVGVEFTVTQDPFQIIWVRKGNALFSMTYSKDQNIGGWSRHSIGPDGLDAVLGLTSIPTALYDKLWVINQHLSGEGNTLVEVMQPLDIQEYPWYVDGGLFYASGIAKDTLISIPYFALAQGAALVYETANSSLYEHNFTFDGSGEYVWPLSNSAIVLIGTRFTSKLTTLPPEILNDRGSTIGLYKNIKRVMLDVYQTKGGAVNGELLEYRSTEDAMDTQLLPYTGLLVVPNPSSNEREQSVTVESDSLFAMHIRKIVHEISVEG